MRHTCFFQKASILEPSSSVVLVLSALIERVILLIYVSFVQSSVVHIAPSGYGYVLKLEFCFMFDTIAYSLLDWFCFKERQDLFFHTGFPLYPRALPHLSPSSLVYPLERIAISMGVDVKFKDSWRGVELEIHHPTDRSQKTPQTQGDQPPSPPLGDSAGKVNLYPFRSLGALPLPFVNAWWSIYLKESRSNFHVLHASCLEKKKTRLWLSVLSVTFFVGRIPSCLVEIPLNTRKVVPIQGREEGFPFLQNPTPGLECGERRREALCDSDDEYVKMVKRTYVNTWEALSKFSSGGEAWKL